MNNKNPADPKTRQQYKIRIEKEYGSFQPKSRSSDIHGVVKLGGCGCDTSETDPEPLVLSPIPIELPETNLKQLTLSAPTSQNSETVDQTFDKIPGTIPNKSPHFTEQNIRETNDPSNEKMANVTITEAFTSQKHPSIPSFISPEIFDPKRDDPQRFIQNYERAAVANAWNDNLKISYFGSFLSGIANRWYENFVTNNATKTWTDVKKEFLKEYRMSDYSEDKERKFENRRQTREESVREYFFDLSFLAYELDPLMEDEKFIKQFERGMHDKYFSNYKILKPDDVTVPELKSIIAKLDAIEQRTKESQGYFHDRQEVEEANKYTKFTTNSRKFDSRPPHLNGGNFKKNVPNTRSSNGRPRCYHCGRIGHFAGACWHNTSGNNYKQDHHPNAKGRRN